MYIDSQCAGGVLWMRRAVSYVVCTCMYVPVGEDFSPFVCMNDMMHLFLFHHAHVAKDRTCCSWQCGCGILAYDSTVDEVFFFFFFFNLLLFVT